MNELHPRFREIFFEVYEALPRQGPGNYECTARAFRLCSGLPVLPVILDLGCGVGFQTLQLAGQTSGSVTAIDNHAPFIERLRRKIIDRGLSQRVRAQVGDMEDPGYAPESCDLIWSEGALYQIGIAKALRICHGLLHPGGYLAFTDAVWRKENPPPEVKASFDLDYPAMGSSDDILAAIEDRGFEPVGRFTLPDQAWWDYFYHPMEARIAILREKYADDGEAAVILDQLAAEPRMHLRYSAYYAYEFFVVRRPFARL